MRVRYRAGDGAIVDTTLDRLTADEVVGGLPVRDFRWRKGQRHYSGWYWSSTVERLVAYESRLELARIMLADFDREVIAIAAQPFQLIGADGARIRRHVPDLLLVGADGGVTVVDVKASDRREDPGVQALFAWTRETVATRGWGFEAWYGGDARLLANVRFLAGYRDRRLVDSALVPAVREAAGTGSRIVDLERALAAPMLLVRPVVLHLLWRGELTADLTGGVLDGMTMVRLAAGAEAA
ncbi:TnsA-like heteromeric transposase endonuclease subunit [Frankia sp. CNm7]|uniref:TnsA-like heteromeric transposase endonuclease subunit n=1 Tax=Frankia nepalensis TaxID=1836974 RepID=A0A937RHS2_9ACTN|nr:TnsA-like heteromeric transposase endonuclease subunit [Frankia nepalensis]MBL7495266.1 TnsA-like heteromeric transposase endonuclease subunit [Frankia nepalensis]MBL7515697.1 TnsA-like heteromeric transposase endonuclease subunit [Frankia nepalensis]MBL7519186.1 TnsA-like heteromeric transposase endonuclease subunit [Frankia nepalensis]MBL7632481.1 TnsA-like heteromeric transposase endonuclease subunit [Frankia nepalensis]